MNLDHENKSAVHGKVLEDWLIAIKNYDYERAIHLDFYHYNNLVKPTEDSQYWDRWQFDTYRARKSLTNDFVNSNPSWCIEEVARSKKFAIVHHNYSGLAHEVQLSRNIQYLTRHGYDLSFDVIYLFGGSLDEQQRSARLYQVSESNIIFLGADSYKTAQKKLDIFCRKISYRTILYPSIFFMGFWMSLFNSHPRQKFLQMKYRPLVAGRIAQWAGSRPGAEIFSSGNEIDYLQLEVLDVRPDYCGVHPRTFLPSDEITFGSISRPEKVAHPEYNKFIESILSGNSHLTYLYAGRDQSLFAIPESVRQRPNAKHIGWVEPGLAIGDFSIYLEPFPWGGGDMTLLALHSGLPYLSLGTEENKKIGMYDFLRSVAMSGPQDLAYSFCETLEDLYGRLLRLAREPVLRRSLGDAWQNHTRTWRSSFSDSWYNFLVN